MRKSYVEFLSNCSHIHVRSSLIRKLLMDISFQIELCSQNLHPSSSHLRRWPLKTISKWPSHSLHKAKAKIWKVRTNTNYAFFFSQVRYALCDLMKNNSKNKIQHKNGIVLLEVLIYKQLPLRIRWKSLFWEKETNEGKPWISTRIFPTHKMPFPLHIETVFHRIIITIRLLYWNFKIHLRLFCSIFAIFVLFVGGSLCEVEYSRWRFKAFNRCCVGGNCTSKYSSEKRSRAFDSSPVDGCLYHR